MDYWWVTNFTHSGLLIIEGSQIYPLCRMDWNGNECISAIEGSQIYPLCRMHRNGDEWIIGGSQIFPQCMVYEGFGKIPLYMQGVLDYFWVTN